MYKQNAYLVMAHNEFNILRKILMLLDDDNADFFLHIDSKADFKDIDELKKCVKKSELFLIKSMDVRWGDRSQIDIEMALLRKSTQREYGYYHLISGVDIPLKTPSEINAFFSKNPENNYIDFDVPKQQSIDRLKYHYYFQRKAGRSKSFWSIVQKLLLALQKLFGINRIKGMENKVYKGANWCSINFKLASYITENFHKYDEMFDRTICADEVFLQTMAMESPYKDTIVKDFLREIDWKRGNPYTYRIEDYDSLMKSKNIFARKFSEKTDSEIVDKLFNDLSDRKNKQQSEKYNN